MDCCDAKTSALLALNYVGGIGNKKIIGLLNKISDFSELKNDKALIIGELGEDKARRFFQNLERVGDIISELENLGVHWLTVFDNDYPEKLAGINNKPAILYLKGNVGAINTDCIAVVGPRNPSSYGKKLTNRFAREFALAGLTVVSGMARGSDTIAHLACVSEDKPTIAVFGCGIDVCYPSENRGLRDSIIDHGGLLVTEYCLKTTPETWFFPERNRIISGLSSAVFLAESSEKSGSLITVKCAIEQGRAVFATPGDIDKSECVGTNKLIINKSALPVMSAEDVLSRLGIERIARSAANTREISIEESRVVELLRKNGEMHIDELLGEVEMSYGELTTLLFNLELDGTIYKASGNMFGLA